MRKNYRKIFQFSFVLFLVSIVLLSIRLSEAFYPDQQIQTVSKIYLSDFENNADEVEKALLSLKETIDTINIDSITQNRFIDILIRKLNQNQYISTYLILEHGRKLSVLEKDKDTYLFAVDSTDNTEVVDWQRLDRNQNIKNTWKRALGVQINILDWGEEVFNDTYNYQIPIWTAINGLMENANRSAALHISWKSKKNNRLLTCIAIIDNFDPSFFLPKSGKLNVEQFITNINDQTFPIFGHAKNDTLVNHLRERCIESWKAIGAASNSTFNFTYNEHDYWGQSLETDIRGIKSYLVVVEENTLDLSSLTRNAAFIVLSAILFIISLLFFVLFRRKGEQTIENYISHQLSDKHASELIKLGENNHLEFKSSFRYDLKEQKVNKDLEYVIAKSIAAFNNAKGGTLIIGVDDDGKILGLENDINTLKRKNLDFFENFLRSFLNKAFSISFVTNNLQIKFPVVDQKVICRIDVISGTSPVFVEVVKNNTKSERFYVRSGNTSMEMKTLSEINRYIQDRF